MTDAEKINFLKSKIEFILSDCNTDLDYEARLMLEDTLEQCD
jgi:hypothetical protein